jgi:hypothetical protein
MTSPCSRSESALRRDDLIFVPPDGVAALTKSMSLFVEACEARV